jgi:hypothetical protein
MHPKIAARLMATCQTTMRSSETDSQNNNQQQPKQSDTMEQMEFQKVLQRIARTMQQQKQAFEDLSDEKTYQQHAQLTIYIANMLLAPQRKRFVVDEHNKQVLRFMLYYFNECPLCEQVFPEKHYKLHNHLLLCGKAGTGKTLLMQIFSEYLHYTNNPHAFYNLSVTQMVNYYTLHNNLDRYTYNEEGSKGFNPQPVNICLNDVGVESKTYFGMDTKLLTNEFLHARNEIWTAYGKHGHVTTNLDVAMLKKEFADSFGRLIDRFKTYNVLTLGGESRR